MKIGALSMKKLLSGYFEYDTALKVVFILLISISFLGFLSIPIILLWGAKWNEPIKSKEGFIYRVYKIDSCEYLEYNRSVTHKGNCTNLIHKTK